MPNMITAEEIADRLQKPPSTVRDYISRYKEWIDRKKIGRFYKYDDINTDKLFFIAQLHDGGMTVSEVKGELDKKYGEDGKSKNPSETALTTQQTTQQLQNFFVAYIAKQDEIVSVMREDLKETREQTKIQREELQLLRDKVLPIYEKIFDEQKKTTPRQTTKKKTVKKATTKKRTRKPRKKVAKKKTVSKPKRGASKKKVSRKRKPKRKVSVGKILGGIFRTSFKL